MELWVRQDSKAITSRSHTTPCSLNGPLVSLISEFPAQGCYRALAYFIVMTVTLTTQTQLCSGHHIFVHLVGRKAQVITTTTVP